MPEDEKTEDKTSTLSTPAKDTGAPSASVSVPQIIAIVAVVIGLIGIGVGGYALYAVKHQAKEYTEAEQDTAKIALCDAIKRVSKSIAINTNLSVPSGPNDPVGALAVAANARMALITGGQYVLDKIDPAVPTDLAATARKYGSTLMDIGVAATAGDQPDDQQQKVRLDDADAAEKQIKDVCK